MFLSGGLALAIIWSDILSQSFANFVVSPTFPTIVEISVPLRPIVKSFKRVQGLKIYLKPNNAFPPFLLSPLMTF